MSLFHILLKHIPTNSHFRITEIHFGSGLLVLFRSCTMIKIHILFTLQMINDAAVFAKKSGSLKIILFPLTLDIFMM